MPYVTSWERMAKKEGKKDGKIEAKHEIASELLRNGVNIDIIAKSTKLPKKEIQKMAGFNA
jgi:predicted transposase/invertase (TIGR01784 family)